MNCLKLYLLNDLKNRHFVFENNHVHNNASTTTFQL